MRTALPAFLVVTLLVAGPSRATVCPAPNAPALAEVDVETRLAFLASAMDVERERLHIWSFSWGSLYSSATAAQLGVLGYVRDPGTRIDLSIGVASGAFGAVSLFLLPLRFIQPMANVRSRWNEADRCKLLADAERTFAQAASDEMLGRSWIGQAGTVAFNLGLVLLSGLGFNRWKSGLISGGIGLVIGELNLWTQPTGLRSKLEDYRAGKFRFRAPALSLGLTPMVGDTNGLGLAFRF